MHNKKFKIIFFLMILFSVMIRFAVLTGVPEGFDQTEAAFGYNAYSVLKSGRDEYGRLLPWVLVSVGDYKLSGFMYWQIPFIAVLGLSEFSTRFSTAVAGMISLFLIYYIVFEIFKNQKLALMTFFMTGISPWHLIFSRMGYDPVVALMFCLLSLALFIYWHKSERLYLIFLSALALSWGIATYYAVWVIFPFMLIGYSVSILKNRRGRVRWISLFIILILPLLVTGKLLIVTGGQRLGQDSTFQVHAQPLLEEQIREDQKLFPLLLTRALHNKLVFYPQIFLQNLSNNLNFDLLFLRGDRLDKRFSVPFHGPLYLWTAPFLVLGILYFWKNHSLIKNLFLLGFIFIVFIGSAFSEFGSETERTILAVPIFGFLISYGLIEIYKKIRSRFKKTAIVFTILVAVFLSLNTAYFYHQYTYHANVHEAWGRVYGMNQMLSKLPAYEGNYEKIVIPDSTYIFYYFYNRTHPQTAWAESANRLDQTNFLGLKLRAKIGNYLTMPVECPQQGRLHVLYVCLGNKIPLNSRVLDIVRYRDDQPAFIFLEFTTQKSLESAPKNVNFTEHFGLIPEGESAYW